MALTFNLAVLPVVAGLVAGTGALTTFMTSPGNVAPSQAARPCEAQTWPYIDATCTGRRAEPDRRVRVVAAPRPGETPGGAANAAPAIPHVAAPQPEPTSTPANVTTRDTVLRSPEIVVPPRKISKREKRHERRERRWATQAYAVPEEAYGRRRAVTVVRPLRLESFR